MTKNTADEMNTWNMVLSVSAALDKTIEQARAEREALEMANPGNPYAPGMGAAVDILDSLGKIQRNLGYEVHRIARSNGLPNGTLK